MKKFFLAAALVAVPAVVQASTAKPAKSVHHYVVTLSYYGDSDFNILEPPN